MASKSSKRRRKRRRSGGGSPSASPTAESQKPAPVPAARSRRRANIDEQLPPAPWGSFPLVELTVLIGIVMLVLGFIFIGGQRGTVLIVTGLALASIGGLEVAVREHFAGFRSHTLILAGVPAAAVLGLLFYAGPDGLPSVARALIGLAVFALAAYLLTRRFQSRSGGYSFRVSKPRRR